MNSEINRLNTFQNWDVPFIDKHQLARFGFYYYGPGDLVRCAFCSVEIGMWEEGDDVLIDHFRWSSNTCPLIRGLPTANVPIDGNILRDQLPPQDFVVVGDVTGSIILFSEIISDNPADMYKIEAERLKSFEEWPIGLEQTPKDLSDAGFFYEGRGDKVTCFSCGGGLKNWVSGEIPWEQHAMYYSNCEYLIQMKGLDFANQFKKQTPPVIETVNVEAEVSVEAEVVDKSVCKICLDVRRNTVFIPCGHVCACVKCAFSVTKCPVCRESFEKVIRIFEC